tara:strand:+ start:1068 stop:1253 length:186 start_codon:yes stop_codon:yes gene_type:complete
MHLLDSRCRLGGNPDFEVIMMQTTCCFATVAPGNEDNARFLLVCGIDSIDYVRGTATRRKR